MNDDGSRRRKGTSNKGTRRASEVSKFGLRFRIKDVLREYRFRGAKLYNLATRISRKIQGREKRNEEN